MNTRQILNNWNKFLTEATKYDEFSETYLIDLDNLAVVATQHGDERSRRHVGKTGPGGQPMGRISRDSIVKALDRALPQLLDDFMNGEIKNKEPFHVKASQGSQTPLNIVGSLDMRKGPDELRIITMMRKDDFRTDAFGGGEQKTYEVNI